MSKKVRFMAVLTLAAAATVVTAFAPLVESAQACFPNYCGY